jgi:hypothetical protein
MKNKEIDMKENLQHDYRGLIDAGLAIDYNILKNNL